MKFDTQYNNFLNEDDVKSPMQNDEMTISGAISVENVTMTTFLFMCVPVASWFVSYHS